MKIKKFNNLWTMGLILSGAILLTVYVLKLFFPEIVIKISHTDNIIKIGKYIDTHKWAYYLVTTIVSFFIYYFIVCASCEKKSLNLKEIIIIIITIIIVLLAQKFLPKQYTVINLISTLWLPILFKGKFFNTVLVFSITNLLQTMTLEIRNIGLMLFEVNYATLLILMIDYYITLVLLYFYFNYKKGEN